MGSLKRTMRRRKEKRQEKDFKEKVGLFLKLGDECMVCLTPFDKTNEEHVKSFYVVVNEKRDQPSLYCPECWEKAKSIIDDYNKEKFIEEE